MLRHRKLWKKRKSGEYQKLAPKALFKLIFMSSSFQDQTVGFNRRTCKALGGGCQRKHNRLDQEGSRFRSPIDPSRGQTSLHFHRPLVASHLSWPLLGHCSWPLVDRCLGIRIWPVAAVWHIVCPDTHHCSPNDNTRALFFEDAASTCKSAAPLFPAVATSGHY